MPKPTQIANMPPISGGDATKFCSKCKDTKALDDFGFRQMKKPDGPIIPQTYCRKCRQE